MNDLAYLNDLHPVDRMLRECVMQLEYVTDYYDSAVLLESTLNEVYMEEDEEANKELADGLDAGNDQKKKGIFKRIIGALQKVFRKILNVLTGEKEKAHAIKQEQICVALAKEVEKQNAGARTFMTITFKDGLKQCDKYNNDVRAIVGKRAEKKAYGNKAMGGHGLSLIPKMNDLANTFEAARYDVEDLTSTFDNKNSKKNIKRNRTDYKFKPQSITLSEALAIVDAQKLINFDETFGATIYEYDKKMCRPDYFDEFIDMGKEAMEACSQVNKLMTTTIRMITMARSFIDTRNMVFLKTIKSILHAGGETPEERQAQASAMRDREAEQAEGTQKESTEFEMYHFVNDFMEEAGLSDMFDDVEVIEEGTYYDTYYNATEFEMYHFVNDFMEEAGVSDMFDDVIQESEEYYDDDYYNNYEEGYGSLGVETEYDDIDAFMEEFLEEVGLDDDSDEYLEGYEEDSDSIFDRYLEGTDEEYDENPFDEIF